MVNYAFDDAARLSQVSSGNGTTVYANNFDYSTAEGLLKSVTMGNGAVESYSYNSRLQVKSLDLTKSGTQLQHYDYKYGLYDPIANTLDETKNTGQIVRIEGLIATVTQWQQNFAYDSLGRLSSAREFRGDTNQTSYVINYDYDVFGNRKQKEAQNQNNPFTQIWTEDSDISQSTNRFAVSVSYDDAGNVLTDQKFRQLKFQYDANNRQKESKNLDNTGAVVSVYDAGGQRVATQVGGSLTNVLVYDAGGKLVAEYGSPASGGTQYLFNDLQGSPRAITSSNGSVISRHDYLPFGEELGAVGMRVNTPGYGSGDNARQKYAGMEGDEATGMAHTLWRQYDSLAGRWTAPDPYGGSMSVGNPQSFNRYSYVENDPVNKIDPLGLALSDIGVYQTDNPASAKYEEKNATWKTLRSATRTGTPRSASARWARNATGSLIARTASFFGTAGQGQRAQRETTKTTLLADVGDIVDQRDGSNDGAPTKYHFIYYGAEANFREAVKIIEMNLGGPAVQFTEVFRTTAHQKILHDRWMSGESSLPADEPGTSTHECGCSFDVQMKLYDFKQQQLIIQGFADHGFIRNRPDDDPVHFTWRTAAEMKSGNAPRFMQLIRDAQSQYANGVYRRR